MAPCWLIDSLQCRVDPSLSCCSCAAISFSLQLCITPNALVLEWYHSVETHMLTDWLTLHGVPTSSIWAGNDLLPTLVIMDLCDKDYAMPVALIQHGESNQCVKAGS